MKNIYKSMYDNRADYKLSINPRIKVMLGMVDSLNLHSADILDFGCYDGTFISMIRNKDNKFYGIEASDYGFKKSMQKGIQTKKMLIGDEDSIPFEEKFFDLVIFGEVIEHVFDTDHILQEIRRILKPNGKLLISTPNIASFGRRASLLLGINPIIESTPNRDDSSGHIRYFTFASFKNLLNENGFKQINAVSDVVNFSSTGKIRSKELAKIIPTLGASIIVLANKK